jgi:hypothetical protein
VSRACHFGGRQWYFVCPYTKRRVSVLWMPPGARYFACRQRWGECRLHLTVSRPRRQGASRPDEDHFAAVPDERC